MRMSVNIDYFRKSVSVRRLSLPLVRGSGRNNTGQLTFGHRGGGARSRFRLVDFRRNLVYISALVLRVESDPNRSAFLALVFYRTGILSYILAAENMVIGSVVMNGAYVAPTVGNSLLLGTIPIGIYIFNIEMRPGLGGAVVRSAGGFGQLLRNFGAFTYVKLPSGEVRRFFGLCKATVGVVSNVRHKFIKLYSAGQRRHLGFRPVVRGVAKNPVDHPHGGGQGKTSGGRKSSLSPWARNTKGAVTRLKPLSRFVVRSRRLLKI